MSILVNRQSRVILQGFTGQHASFHAREAIAAGTLVVGAVTPGKGGHRHLDLAVFDTVQEAVEATGADVSGILVPSPFAANAIMEAIDAAVAVIVVITDGIPVQDMVRVRRYLVGRESIIIGPNTAGIITPGGVQGGHHAGPYLPPRQDRSGGAHGRAGCARGTQPGRHRSDGQADVGGLTALQGGGPTSSRRLMPLRSITTRMRR
jgi:succinyl-CoA synthetase alpha subunit